MLSSLRERWLKKRLAKQREWRRIRIEAGRTEADELRSERNFWAFCAVVIAWSWICRELAAWYFGR
jgi:hypothetical protein